MKKLLIAFCLCFCCIGVSYAECSVKKPSVQLSFHKIEPQYYSKPAKDVQKACSAYVSYVPVGCTRYYISYEYNYKTSKGKGCKQITNVEMKLYYKKGDFYVYIDDRYPEGSCEYNAIKKHEDMHVKIDQTVRKKKMKKKLEECILKINEDKPKEQDLNTRVGQCAKEAFDWDENIRKNKNKELDFDEEKQPGALDKSCKWEK